MPPTNNEHHAAPFEFIMLRTPENGAKRTKRRLKKGESRIDAESFILLTLNDHTQRTGSQFSSSPYHLIIITSSDH